MGTLGTGERLESSGRRGFLRLHPNLHLLRAKKLDADAPMNAPTPVMPEKRLTPDEERMQEQAHLARLSSSAALPLALLAQRTGTTTADAGSIHHA